MTDDRPTRRHVNSRSSIAWTTKDYYNKIHTTRIESNSSSVRITFVYGLRNERAKNKKWNGMEWKWKKDYIYITTKEERKRKRKTLGMFCITKFIIIIITHEHTRRRRLDWTGLNHNSVQFNLHCSRWDWINRRRKCSVRTLRFGLLLFCHIHTTRLHKRTHTFGSTNTLDYLRQSL